MINSTRQASIATIRVILIESASRYKVCSACHLLWKVDRGVCDCGGSTWGSPHDTLAAITIATVDDVTRFSTK